MASAWFVSGPVDDRQAESAAALLNQLGPLVAADEYLVVLVIVCRFDRLLRKNDLLDEGVAAVFGLAHGMAELLCLCFHSGKFTPDNAKAWLAERRFTPPADAPIMRRSPLPLT